MLSRLFGSNARVKILKIFLLHPDKKYYIRQLARDLKLQVNSVRRELENLEMFGILISSASDRLDRDKGNIDGISSLSSAKTSGQEKKYYQANKNFILFEEIKALIVKSQILYEKDFIKKLQNAGKPKLFILSGIFVNSPDSLVDIFIVGRFNKNKLLKVIKDLENELGQELNFSLMDFKEFKYRRDITDIFLYGILEGRKIVVVDDNIMS